MSSSKKPTKKSTAKKPAAKKPVKTAAKPAKPVKKAPPKPTITVQVGGGNPKEVRASNVGELKEKLNLDSDWQATINGVASRRPSDPLRDGMHVVFSTKITHGS